MALEFFENYLKNVAYTPTQRYMNDMQNFINNSWENTPQTTGKHSNLQCLVQDSIGSKLYSPVDVSIDMQVELSTGTKVSDDYKIFSHKNLSTVTQRGLMYKFMDNYWLSIDVDEYASPIKSVGVRRCNNVAKWIDPENGSLIQWPCIIDYDVSGTAPKYDKDINTANGHFTLIIQGNQDTLKLKKNQRFLFNGEPYKLTGFNNMLQNEIVDSSTTLLYYDLFVDTIESNDNVEDSIANATEYIYTVEVQLDAIEQISGFKGKINTTVKLNGNVVNRNVDWTSNEFGDIMPDGSYVLNGNVGDIAIFTYTFGDIVGKVEVKIVESVTDVYDIIVEPYISTLYQGETTILSVYLYKNGEIQQDEIVCAPSGADSVKNYILTQNGHEFSITNVLRSIKPLKLIFQSGKIVKEIEIQLKALF